MRVYGTDTDMGINERRLRYSDKEDFISLVFDNERFYQCVDISFCPIGMLKDRWFNVKVAKSESKLQVTILLLNWLYFNNSFEVREPYKMRILR